MSPDHWSGLPYLDVLRPEQDRPVEWAILTTYSLDLVALVASMLALAGLDDDQGSGSKVDFANAYEQMRGRLRVLVQAGRIAWPRGMPSLVGILDRFIQEIPQDENLGSWHPKIALIKYRSEKADTSRWRLWIGSRNLTQTMSWDAGLLLHGGIDLKGHKLPGISDLGFQIANLARLDGYDAPSIAKELQQVNWQGPEGVTVEDLRLLMPGQERSYPAEPNNLRRLTLVSPFLDGATIKKFGRWGDEYTERYLVGTLPEMAKLKAQAGKPLRPFETHLLTLDAPTEDEILDDPSYQPVKLSEAISNEELLSRELHAKLILAEHRQGYTLWLGSANATHRGWLGPNFEVVARMAVNQTVADGLQAFIELAKTVALSDIPNPSEEDATEKRLETACIQVVNRWQAKQIRQSDGVNLVAEQAPHPDDPDILLEVGLVTGGYSPWSPGVLSVHLPLGSMAKETDLIQVQLSLGERKVAWLQLAPLDPPPDEERDHRALAAHLGPRTFLLWLRSMLSVGELLDGGGAWHAGPRTYRSNETKGPTWWAPTLEEVLSSWTRDPENLSLVDQKVQNYLRLLREDDHGEYSKEEQDLLHKFEDTWQVIRKALLRRPS